MNRLVQEWPDDRGLPTEGSNKATGWDSAGRARYLTVKPWYWRFMPFVLDQTLLTKQTWASLPFTDTHGVATEVVQAMAVIVWPKPAHLAVRWSFYPVRQMARYFHGILKAAGHRDPEGAWCDHPLMRWYFWLADNIYECRWIRVSPTITVHDA